MVKNLIKQADLLKNRELILPIPINEIHNSSSDIKENIEMLFIEFADVYLIERIPNSVKYLVINNFKLEPYEISQLSFPNTLEKLYIHELYSDLDKFSIDMDYIVDYKTGNLIDDYYLENIQNFHMGYQYHN